MARPSSSRSQHLAMAVIWCSTTQLHAFAEGFVQVDTPELVRQFEGDLVEKLSAMREEPHKATRDI